MCGYATPTDVGGVFEVHFPFNPVPGDYEVLDTDYESYACVWSCFGDPLGLTHSEIGYILTREQEFNQETVRMNWDTKLKVLNWNRSVLVSYYMKIILNKILTITF